MKNTLPKISAFSFLRNAVIYDLPFIESVKSVLPVVDEFVIALATSTDDTLKQLQALSTSKIKIIQTDWKINDFYKNTEYARQTDIAKAHCTGDWLLYVQGDEVYHEDDLPRLLEAVYSAQSVPKADGLLVKFLHFWGDYEHVHKSHAWYKQEIRVIRNLPQIHSWRDAQSFRFYTSSPQSAEDYLNKKTTRKLRVLETEVRVFHYGHVKRLKDQCKKVNDASASHRGTQISSRNYTYGRIADVPRFEGTHPSVMHSRIKKFYELKDKPDINGRRDPALHKHERLKYRLLSYVENTFFGGKTLFGFKNFKRIANPKN